MSSITPGTTCILGAKQVGAKDTSMSGSCEQSKQTSSSLPCCNDFISTNQFTGSKDTPSKQIDFCLLFCSPAASLGAATSEVLAQLASVPFALRRSAPRSCGARCPRWPACGVCPVPNRSRGPAATRTAGPLRGGTAEGPRGSKAATGGGRQPSAGGGACLAPQERRGQARRS